MRELEKEHLTILSFKFRSLHLSKGYLFFFQFKFNFIKTFILFIYRNYIKIKEKPNYFRLCYWRISGFISF
jgi:hypothetical protein